MDARACVAAGAGAVHLHPRDQDGVERLDAATVDSVVEQVRSACRVEVGVSTGAWIEPDLPRRLELIRAWKRPDYASVNVSEPGAQRVMHALLEVGIGVEAGVWTVQDAVAFSGFDLRGQLTRILVEPVEVSAANAVPLVRSIHEALDRFDQSMPRLQHGDGEATWVLIDDAIRNGYDTRVGLEDTLYGPDGKRVSGNRALVEAASNLIAQLGRHSKESPP
jgi:uncharacterized protein (DUF849 family)